MTDTIEVVDYIMGSGKTTEIIKWMQANKHNKYLFVSPLLSEVEQRIPEEAEGLDFVYPHTEQYITKREHLKHLLAQERNICFTHALYSDMDKHCLHLIREAGYILILDEEVNFIQAMEGYTRSDIKSLLEANHISIDGNDLGKVSWHWDIENGHKFSKLKALCEIGCVYAFQSESKDSKQNETVTVHLPTELITSCERVVLLTYGFKGGILERFLSLKGIKIKDFKDIDLSDRDAYIRKSIIDRIILVDTPSTRKISKYSMSYSWWTSDSKLDERKEVFNVIKSVAKGRDTRAKKADFMYTLPNTVAERTSSKIVSLPYDDCFVSRSTRATNIYQHKWCLVHAYNRRPNVSVQIYLRHYLHDVDDESFALYEMLQWIWRSRIRTPTGNIYLAILPKRMKDLFTEWLSSI